MTKIRLIFVMTNLRKGGIATSLVNLLNTLSLTNIYDLTLFLFDDNIQIDYYLNPNIHIIFGNKFSSLLSNSISDSKRFGLIFFLFRIFLSFFTLIFSYKLPYKFLFTKFPKLTKYYDIAISSTQSSPLNRLYGGCNEFLISKVKAKKYLTFIHTDITKHKINTIYTHRIIKSFNYLITVSQSLRKNLKSIFKEIPDHKIIVLENLHSISEFLPYKPISNRTNEIRILTVSRASREKGLNMIIDVSKFLKNHNIKFNWNVIGNGSFLKKYIYLTKKSNLLDCLHFLGKSDNTIPYYLEADLFVLPSLYEGAPMVLEEAKIFGCYILSTNTISAKEILGDYFGKICKVSKIDLYKNICDIIEKKKYKNYYGTNYHKEFLTSLKNREKYAINLFKVIFYKNDNNYRSVEN